MRRWIQYQLMTICLLSGFIACQGGNTDPEEETVPTNTAPVIKGTLQGSVDEDNYSVVSSKSILKVKASDEDGDTLKYTIKERGVPFSISRKGVITATGLLDYENTPSYQLTVEVTDGIDKDRSRLTIDVNNLNDNPIEWARRTNRAFIVEDVPSHTLITIVPEATDADGIDTITYHLDDDYDGRFLFDTNRRELRTGETGFDSKTRESYDVIITATDGETTLRYTLTVNISESVTMITSASNGQVNEGHYSAAVPSETIVTIKAIDANGDPLLYSIQESELPFAINHEGAITATGFIDYEHIPSYELTVEVTDGTHTDMARLTIDIQNLNDTLPIWQSASQTVELAENIKSNTFIVFIPEASDADKIGTITYRLADDYEGRFSFNPTNMELKTGTHRLDYETVSNYVLLIEADDGENTNTYRLIVNVLDANDPPVWMSDVVTDQKEICESMSAGDVIATFPEATDENNDRISYRLKADHDYMQQFTLDVTSRELRKGTLPFDYTDTSHYEVIIEAYDGTDATEYLVTVQLIQMSRTFYVARGGLRSVRIPAVTALCMGGHVFAFQSNTVIDFHSFSFLTDPRSGRIKRGELASNVTWTNTNDETFTFTNAEGVDIVFHSNTSVKQGRLASNMTWTNTNDETFTFTHENDIFFHEGGSIARGRLQNSKAWTNNFNETFHFTNTKDIHFYSNGVVSAGHLTNNYTWNNQGTFIFDHIHQLSLHPNGKIKGGRLVSIATWTNGTRGQFLFSTGHNLYFHDNGVVSNGRLATSITWTNGTKGQFHLSTTRDVDFYTNGSIKSGIIGADSTWAHPTYGNLTFLGFTEFYSDGKVIYGTLTTSKTFVLNETNEVVPSYSERGRVKFDSNGVIIGILVRGHRSALDAYKRFYADNGEQLPFATGGTSDRRAAWRRWTGER